MQTCTEHEREPRHSHGTCACLAWHLILQNVCLMSLIGLETLSRIRWRCLSLSHSLAYLAAEICKSCWSSRGQVERTRLLLRLRKLQVKHKFHIFILHISLDNAAIYCTLFLCLSLSLFLLYSLNCIAFTFAAV